MASSIGNCNYKHQLHANVASAETLEKLMPFLQSMSLDNLKEIVHQCIDNIDDTNSATLYFKSSSIDEILPTDIIRHILSFQPPSDLYISKQINKQWNVISSVSEKKYFTSLKKQLDQECPIKYDDKKHSTLIVHDGRSKLTAIESEMGFKGVFVSINRAIKESKPGDRILIHKGCHYIKNIIECETNVSLIGLERMSVVIVDAKPSALTGVLCLVSQTSIYIQNLTFDGISRSNRKYGISFATILNGGRLWAHKCRFYMRNTAICVKSAGYVFLRHCDFDGGRRPISAKVSAKKLKVYGCTFRNCVSVIEIKNYGNNNDDKKLNLNCKGNVFRNVSFAPLYEMRQADRTAYSQCIELYSLKNNVMKGSLAKFKANKIYDMDMSLVYRNRHSSEL